MRVYEIENDRQFRRWLEYEYRTIYDLGKSTGLRVSDIVRLPKAILTKKEPTITEQKTGKSKRFYIPKKVRQDMEIFAAKSPNEYIFYSEKSNCGHITRQAVWKRFKIAAERANISTNVGTHSMRKKYAMREYQRNGLRSTQKKLNHSNTADTILYLLHERRTHERL